MIVDLDATRRRLSYSARRERLTHHNASVQVLAEGDGSRLISIADVLPHEAVVMVGGMMTQGLAIRATLEQAAK